MDLSHCSHIDFIDFHEMFDADTTPSLDLIQDDTQTIDSDVNTQWGSEDLGIDTIRQYSLSTVEILLGKHVGKLKDYQFGILNTTFDPDGLATPWDADWGSIADSEKRPLQFLEHQIDGIGAIYRMLFLTDSRQSKASVLLADGMGLGKTWCVLCSHR